jgi:nitric oxide reductase large subunit
MALALGVVLAVLVVLLSGAGSVLARGMLVAFSVLWFGVGGLLGTALLLAGAVTKHAPYMGANLTVLQVHPLMLLAAVVVTVALWRRTRTGAAAGVAALVALLSVVGLTLQLVPVLSQESGVVLALVVPVQVAFAVAVLRLRPRVRPDGATP